ncbi:hypothetical protein [Streptomyces sp. NPDC002788]
MGSLRVTVCTSVLAVVALTPVAHAADGGGVTVTPATPAPGSDVTLRLTDCAERTAVAASKAFVADARLTVIDGRELAGDSRVRSTLEPGTYAVQVTCGSGERTGTFTVRGGPGRDLPSGSGSSASGAEGEPSRSGTGETSSVTGVGEGASVTGAGDESSVTGAGDESSVTGAGGEFSVTGVGEGVSATGGGDESSVTGTDGQPPAPGTVGRPPVPGKGGQPSAPATEEPSPGAPASPVAPVQAGGGGAADLVAAEDRGAGPNTAHGVTGLVLAGVAAVVVALGGVRRGRGTG